MSSEPTLPAPVLEKTPTNRGPSPALSTSSANTTDPSNDPNPNSQGKINAYATTFHPGWRFYAAFVSLCVITLMAALDATSLSVAIPKITALLYVHRNKRGASL